MCHEYIALGRLLLKEGSHFDLPIALALLAETGAVERDELARYLVLGELGLDGALASWAGGLEVVAAPSLVALINHLKRTQVPIIC